MTKKKDKKKVKKRQKSIDNSEEVDIQGILRQYKADQSDESIPSEKFENILVDMSHNLSKQQVEALLMLVDKNATGLINIGVLNFSH
jgi:Ca2+-binding EF-hand superfamily protein